jgi:hypothetical protein
MAWTIVQHTANSGLVVDPAILSFGGNVTAGNLLVLIASVGDNGTVPTITWSQSAGSATIGVVTQPAAGTARDATNQESLQIAYALVTNTGSCTIKVSTGQSGSPVDQITMSEWSGNAASSPGDQFGAAVTSGSTFSTPSITPGSSGDLLIAVAFDDSGGGQITSTGSGWTALDLGTGGNLCVTQYLVQVTAALIATSFANTANDTVMTAIGSFKAAGGVALGPVVDRPRGDQRPFPFLPGGLGNR